jgi:hypothetical protein
VWLKINIKSCYSVIPISCFTRCSLCTTKLCTCYELIGANLTSVVSLAYGVMVPRNKGISDGIIINDATILSERQIHQMLTSDILIDHPQIICYYLCVSLTTLSTSWHSHEQHKSPFMVKTFLFFNLMLLGMDNIVASISLSHPFLLPLPSTFFFFCVA